MMQNYGSMAIAFLRYLIVLELAKNESAPKRNNPAYGNSVARKR